MKLTQLLQVFWARKGVFLAVTGGIFIFALILSLVSPKEYVAEVSLVADIKSTDPVSGAQLFTQDAARYSATQIDVIASRNVALKVVDKFKLTQLPDVQEQFQDAMGGAGSIRDWVADLLLNNVNVKTSRESNVIDIDYSSSDPNVAADLANAFANAYIETSLELKMDPARRQSGWFDEQLQGLRKTLEDAQRRLSEYQRKNNVVGVDSRLDIENARLSEISNQLVGEQTTMYDAQTRQKQMTQALGKNQLEQLPDILGNGLLQGMKADLTRAEAKLAESAERYGKNHPQYISSTAEVQTLRSKLAAELDTAKGSINQAARIAEQRAAEVQRAVDAQKARILELKQQRNEFDVLNRDVESAQRTYDAASQRASQVRLESQLDQSSIAVLNPAIPPIKPARPRVLLNLALAVILGSVLSAGSVLCIELLDRRVRNEADVVEAGGLMVLAELPRFHERRKSRAWIGKTSLPTVAGTQSP